MTLSCGQRFVIPSATRVAGYPLAPSRLLGLVRSVRVTSEKPVAGHPLAHAPFLPDARAPRVSATKTGRGCLRQPRSLAAPGDPLAGTSSRTLAGPLDLTVRGLPSGTRVRRFLFPVRTSGSATPPPLHTDGIDVGRLIRSTEAAAAHDIAAARATAIGQGLLDLAPSNRALLPGAGRYRVRCWIQTPRRWQRRAHDRFTPRVRG